MTHRKRVLCLNRLNPRRAESGYYCRFMLELSTEEGERKNEKLKIKNAKRKAETSLNQRSFSTSLFAFLIFNFSLRGARLGEA
ncbi:MAG TPA: hypothetical protein VGC87_26490 [Pyrinomonadaceae bacterium]|jgi:hypothetical protein